MALTAKLLQLRPKSRPIPNPSFTHSFSSSSDEPNPNPSTTTTGATSSPSPSQSQSSFSSYFSDVKASLKQQSPPPGPSPPRKPFNLSSTNSTAAPTPPSKIGSLEEIRKNLSEFRRRAAAPLPSPSSGDGKPTSSAHSQPVSFQELYKRNVISKGENDATTTNQPPAGKFSFDAIRESLRQLKSSTAKNQAGGVGQMNDSMSLSRFKESLKLRPMDPNAKGSPVVIGGSDNLPVSVFGKEMRDTKEGNRDKDAMRTEFVKIYDYPELGQKLRMLRPEKKDGKSWFTLAELNERLMKLREYEEKESESRIGGVTFKDLRDSLEKLKRSEDDKKKSTTMQRLDVLGQIGGTPSFMLSPPKEHLVENYFHPDNMSSAEKLKLELKKVRDEYKMSESDCGSARVQVAQLTTKIKHLSSALHKKDKHSRKGLLAMVQRRKKLLKYLRRTDWDSYCLVLSKLGLRDNPDYKA